MSQLETLLSPLVTQLHVGRQQQILHSEQVQSMTRQHTRQGKQQLLEVQHSILGCHHVLRRLARSVGSDERVSVANRRSMNICELYFLVLRIICMYPLY